MIQYALNRYAMKHLVIIYNYKHNIILKKYSEWKELVNPFVSLSSSNNLINNHGSNSIKIKIISKHLPFLHWPCSLHLASHCFRVQYSPDHPASQTHASPTHRPFGPQSKSQSSDKNINKICYRKLFEMTILYGY